MKRSISRWDVIVAGCLAGIAALTGPSQAAPDCRLAGFLACHRLDWSSAACQTHANGRFRLCSNAESDDPTERCATYGQ
jgi:hypothetical protein